jgi:glutamyl-tRNA reductase
MRLLVLGVSHHTAPIDLRERLAFGPSDLAGAIGALAQDAALGEVVLLSTCNRTEIYATCPSPTRRGISSASPPGSIRWSSASRRSSAR